MCSAWLVITDPLGYPRTRRIQRNLFLRDEAQLQRVVSIEPKVVNGVSIHGVQLHLFTVEKDAFGRDGACRDDVAIRENQTPFRVDDEAGGLQGCVRLRIETARQIELYRDDSTRNLFERARPLGAAHGSRDHGIGVHKRFEREQPLPEWLA